MRNYATWGEAHNEIQRDLNELGVTVKLATMQDKDIKDDPEFYTKELANYGYTVLDPMSEVPNLHEEWAKQEWEDRVIGELNPGKAWRLRPEVWEQFLEKRTMAGQKLFGRFSYTYSQRMGGHRIERIIDELALHPTSRQLWLPVWWPIDETRRGERRVPCSLGYGFLLRQGALHLTYVMRSCDFFTHWPQDVWLAAQLLAYVAKRTDNRIGTVTHQVFSLHVYAKDVKGVF